MKYNFDWNKDGVLGIKSPILFKEENGKQYPLIYFKKPKHISQEEFENTLKKLLGLK